MNRLLQLFRIFSYNSKQSFYYTQENEDFRRTMDSVRARVALNRWS